MKHLYMIALATAALTAGIAHAGAPATKDPLIERGRYLTRISGCNDCHTPGYAPNDGKVAESQWLTGDTLGWQGPWGTTYPTNLRLFMPQFDENAWVEYARRFRPRPPMPWFNVADMSDEDLRAFYRYVVFLGPAGAPAPAYVPPGRQPNGPAVRFPEPPPGGSAH